MGNPAIEVEGLRVRRGGREVLRDIGCTVRRGTVTGLLGPNGCSKSTLMRSIVGVQIVESGRVTVLRRPAGARSCAGGSATRPRIRRFTQI